MRHVTESIRIVIRTPEGNRLEVEGRGDNAATHGMHTAFNCLTRDRREKLLATLTDAHSDLCKQEADRASQ